MPGKSRKKTSLWMRRARAWRVDSAWERLPAVYWFSSYLHSLGKLLLIGEDGELIQQWGPWLLSGWNIVATSAVYALWRWWPSQSRAVASEIESKKKEESEEESDSDETGDEKEEAEKSPLSRTEQLRLLAAYSLPYWRYSLTGGVFMLISSWASLQYPFYEGLVMSAMLEHHEQHIFTVAMVALSLAGKVFEQLEDRSFTDVSKRITLQVRRDYFRHIMHQEVGYFDQPGNTSAMSRGLNYGCDQVGSAFSKDVIRFLDKLIMLAGAFLAMVSISWRLSLVPLALIPLTTYLTNIWHVGREEYYEASWKAENKASRVVSDTTNDMRTVRAFASEDYECERYAERTGGHFEFEAARLRSARANVKEWLWQVNRKACFFLTLIYSGHLVGTGRMEAPAIITFLLFERNFSNYFDVGI